MWMWLNFWGGLSGHALVRLHWFEFESVSLKFGHCNFHLDYSSFYFSLWNWIWVVEISYLIYISANIRSHLKLKREICNPCKYILIITSFSIIHCMNVVYVCVHVWQTTCVCFADDLSNRFWILTFRLKFINQGPHYWRYPWREQTYFSSLDCIFPYLEIYVPVFGKYYYSNWILYYMYMPL
jgi:hypothetical protein